jgi:chromosome segregation ATPase
MHQNKNQNQSQSPSQRSEELLDKLTDLQDKYDFQLSRMEAERVKHDEYVRKAKQEVSEKEKQLKQLKADIHLAKNTVKERQEYLLQQEETISKVMEQGNNKLFDLKDEIDSTERQLSDYNSQMIIADNSLTEIKFNHELQKDKLELEIFNLTNEKNDLLVKVSMIKDKLKVLENVYESKIQEMEEKRIKLEEKELSVKIKTESLINERTELEIQKRRFKSEKALFDM